MHSTGLPNLAFALVALFLLVTPANRRAETDAPASSPPPAARSASSASAHRLLIWRDGEALNYRFNGNVYRDPDRLSAALRDLAKDKPGEAVWVTVGEGVRFGEVRPLLERIREAGLEPAFPMTEEGR